MNAPLRPEVLQAVSDLIIRPRSHVSSLLTGNFRSAFRGAGMHFKEFRRYEPGDDIRHMSWSVTARTRKATVKVYEEERELQIILLVDVSGSSLFGSGERRKVDMQVELVALLTLAAIKSGDRVGMLLFNEEPVLYVPPRSGRSHVQVLMTKILEQPIRPSRSDLASSAQFLMNTVKGRSLVLVLSDFHVQNWESSLSLLVKKHELTLLHCYDDAERGFGWDGVREVWDPETGEFFLMDGNSRRLKSILTESHTQLTNNLEGFAQKTRADYITLSVQDDYLQRLVHHFRLRGRGGV